MRRLITIALVLGIVAAACGGGEEGGGVPDLEIERRVGYAVVVDEQPDGLAIGFSNDRDAEAGEEFDVSQAIWREEDGPWTAPPVTCLAIGRRVELGITQVETEERPGLLRDRVVWLACLPPEDS